MIYFVCPTYGGPILIGHAHHLRARLAQLARELGTPPCVLGVVPGCQDRASEMQERFARLSTGAGWFRPALALLKFIAAESHTWTETPVDREGDAEVA